ncbi:Rap1a/Tai family immunity protein [Pseudotabrizicola sp. 4114]|uniref:Rap1a/Tai family immunity protein n=1 Tax=Pseudotabrizicola sp. 4114 TaxID=2817731 RepID=UPI00285F338F|nr:hypothetical protein [Pseudorhodobacter sp. 4114]
MKAGALVCLLLVLSESVEAQPVTGNELFEACDTDGLAQAGYCIGYILGAVEGMRWGIAAPLLHAGGVDVASVNQTSNSILQICEPDGVIAKQYTDIVIGYLRTNPAMRHRPARGLIQIALGEAFPCQQ